jgi:superfamily II DNA or RNA helicase
MNGAKPIDAVPMTALRPLRPRQQDVINDLRAAFASGKRAPMVQAPCGFGKTVLAAHVVHGARLKKIRVGFAVPALSLIEQTFDRMRENGFDPADMGILQGSHPWYRPHAPIQICSAQTVDRRGWPNIDLLVIDEAHLRFKVYETWTGKKIGLSATPWSKGLGLHFDTLIKGPSDQELIDDGMLSQFKVFAPSHPDLAGVETRETANGRDYVESQLGERMSKPELVADAVKTWLERGRGQPTLCFAVNRAHAALLAERFSAAGVRTGYVDAFTPREDRDEMGRKLGAGELGVVVNIGCLTTGVDWIVRCLILCRPTKSEILFKQILGRCLRPEYADGFDLNSREGRLAAMAAGPKPFATILDHSDTHLRLGMVTDIDHDELHDGKITNSSKADDEEREERLPRECRDCAGLIPPGASECPCCGAVQRRASNVAEKAGELAELKPGAKKAKRKSGEPVIEFLRGLDKSDLYAQLAYIADERGRSSGWVAHKYREVHDVWPTRVDRERRTEPSNTLRNWVRSRDIAWARSQPQREDAA